MGRLEGVHDGARRAKGSETEDARLLPDRVVHKPRDRPFPGDEDLNPACNDQQVLADYPEELRGDVSMHLHKEVFHLSPL